MNKNQKIDLFSSTLMNAIDALVVVLDLNGRIVFINSACEKLTGFKLADVKGRAVWENFIIPEEIEEAKVVFSGLVTFQRNSRHINHWLTNAGEKKLVSWSNTCLFNDDGTLEYIVETGIDITEQRKAQLALEEREAKFQAIITSAQESIIRIDDKGIIDEANLAVESVFGYKQEEVIGQNIKLLMPEPYYSQHDGFLADFAKTGKKKIIGMGREVEGKHKDGTVFPIHLSVSAISSKDKNFFIGVIHDLTKMKQQEQKLRRAHKVEALGQLTGGIAHDFNNLLTIILGNLEILDGQNLGAEATEILDEVFEVIGQGTELVSQLLAFGKRQSLHPEIINVNVIIKQLTQLLLRTFREDIEVRTELHRNLWNSCADPNQVENALLNIVLNARDAMPDGGKIIVKTANVIFTANNIPDTFQITSGEYIELSVSDTGVGMSEDVLARVYDPFFTTKGVGYGTGLGLSMVHGFIEQSSGSIMIESEEGHGTTVSIYLPRDETADTDNASQKNSAGRTHEGEGNKILHIEDDPKVRQINTKRLMAFGYNVLTAKDALSGLKILSENDDVQLVFSDIVMPGGMSGIELAKEIKVLYPEMKILLTTGYSEEINSGGIENFVVLKKPFTKQELSTKLDEFF